MKLNSRSDASWIGGSHEFDVQKREVSKSAGEKLSMHILNMWV